MKLGAKIFGVLSGALLLYLAFGWLLPGSWEAEANVKLEAPPSTVFPFLNRPDLWMQWNTMPESGFARVGLEEGTGAGLEWDDPQYGKGRYRILESEGMARVTYEVLIEDGALTIHGALVLSSEGGGSRLAWTERGDFGWNPLMGYAARGMSESQGQAMTASLDTLRLILQKAGPDPEGGGD